MDRMEWDPNEEEIVYSDTLDQFEHTVFTELFGEGNLGPDLLEQATDVMGDQDLDVGEEGGC